MSRKPWSPPEIEMLGKRYADERAKDISSALGRSVASVYGMANKIGLKKSEPFKESIQSGRLIDGVRGKSTRFQAGQASWNKGKSFPSRGRSAETQFKPGVRQGQAVKLYQPIGAERISKDGYLQRKINDDLPLQKRWRGVHLILWEEINGPLPAGHALVFRDGDKTNIVIGNLELITRRELMARNTVHNLPPQLKEVVDLKRHITRHINRKEKERAKHD